jgi:long-subunit fatty acid transport protein
MKKLFSLAAGLLIGGSIFAGGLVTNTNQSAMYTRMQCRDATLGIDAVYFNPAGLTKLADGFHFSLSNQTLGQTRTITNNYPYLAGAPETTYEGTVSAPLFPSVYAAYKTGKFVISGGFNVIGGGGGATFEKGLPSFEMPISDVVPSLQSSLAPLDAGVLASPVGTDPMFRNVTGYSADIFFEGTSAYFGYQLNASYEINDMISVAVGGRYVVAKDAYTGSIENVMITAVPNAAMGLAAVGGTLTPGQYLRNVAATPYADAGTAATLNGTAAYLDGATSDKYVDVEFAASGFTPIVSVNIAPSENLNIALKYEGQTKLEMETKINDNKDGGGMYVEGDKFSSDMPGQITAGVMYKPMDKLMLTTGIHYYLDKAVDWDGSDDIDSEQIDNNFIEFALGLEYGLNEQLSVSAGWLTTITGVNDTYQSDLTYSLPTNTFGAGIGYKVNDMIDLSLGGSYTVYTEGSVNFDHMLGAIAVPVTETYDKDVWIVAVGVNFSFGGAK